MRRRCTDTRHDNYKFYGGRGVTTTWNSLQDFLKDVDSIDGWDLDKFMNHELQLDKDLKGARCYSLETCTWLSPEKNRQLEHEQAGHETVNAESPTGVLYKVSAVKPFCREHSLASTSVFKMMRGGQSSVNGWLFWREGEGKPNRPPVYQITKPDSTIILFSKYSELRQYGINEERIRECVKGKRESTKEGLTASIVNNRTTIDDYWFNYNRRLNRNV